MPTPHISAAVGEIAPNVLMPGDPRRAKKIAEAFLDDARLVSDVRSICAYTGTYKGVPMTAMASGMGVPSIGIYATELFRFYNVESIVRVGTCGVWDPDISVGDVIIGSAAHTDSALPTVWMPGVTLGLAPHHALLGAAVAAANHAEAAVHIGPIFSSDYFYTDRPDSFLSDLSRYGTLGVEMESASLYGVAMRERKKALTVLTASDHMTVASQNMTPEERENCFYAMVRIAAEAMAHTA